jgi:hypothetical protein
MLAGLSTVEYIRKAPDPTNTAVFLEDLVAVGGVGVAAAGIGLSVITGACRPPPPPTHTHHHRPSPEGFVFLMLN